MEFVMGAVKEPEFERMLPVADVCRYLSISDETVYSWIRKPICRTMMKNSNSKPREE